MRVILIDDDPIILEILKKLLFKIPDIEVIGVFQNGTAALSFLKENKADVAFIDIHLAEENGLQLARELSYYRIDTEVVFISASTEHALEAFDVFAFDYIVKPVTLQRLEKTIARLLNMKYKYKSSHYDASIYCLGSLDVLTSSFEKVKWISSKSEEVFFYLLQNHGRSVSRYILIEEIFGGMPVKNAETYLNTAIYQLRKTLDALNMRTAMISTSDGYYLNLKDCYIDFIDFENKLKQLDIIDESNLKTSIEVEMLYKGDLYGDKAYLWALAARARVYGLYEKHAKKLIHYLLEIQRTTEALEIIHKLIRFNELDEDSNSLLLKLYAFQKDKTAFVKHYSWYASILKKETGDKPSKSIANLYAELRSTFNQI